METKSLVQTAVAVLVAVVVFTTVLIPITTESASAYSKFTNDGVFDYGIFTPDDEYSMKYDLHTGTITVNGNVVTPVSGVGPGSGVSYSIIATENALFRFGYDAVSYTTGYYMQIIGVSASGATFLAGGASGTVTISNGQLNISTLRSDGTTQEITVNFSEMYSIVSSKDSAVLKVSTSAAYINKDSEIYATGISNVTAWNNAFHIEGTLNEGLTISSPNLPTATYDNIIWNIEQVDGYKDLFKLTSIEFDVTYEGNVTHLRYAYFAVPTVVMGEKAVHVSDSESALISVIPLLVIVGLILSVIGIAIARRYDL